jgi:hypothetical protein
MSPLAKGENGEYKYKAPPKSKYYSLSSIFLGSLVGGPLAGFHMIAENYRALEEPERIGLMKWFGMIGMGLIFGSWGWGEGNPLNLFAKWQVVMFYTLGITALANKLQGTRLRQLTVSKRPSYGYGQVMVVAAGALAMSLALMVFMTMAAFFCEPIPIKQGIPRQY